MEGNDKPPKVIGLEYTRHAIYAMMERTIPIEWVERAVADPVLRVPDPNDPEVERFFRPIPENSGRVLRVAVNTHVAPWRVLSAFLTEALEANCETKRRQGSRRAVSAP